MSDTIEISWEKVDTDAGDWGLARVTVTVRLSPEAAEEAIREYLRSPNAKMTTAARRGYLRDIADQVVIEREPYDDEC